MEAVTIQKFIHTTPRKLRLVADMVRDLEPGKAVETLRFTPKMAAVDLGKAIKTAVANARSKGMEEYIFKALEVNEASKMKRFRAGTRGRAKPYARRMAHIKIVLSDEISQKGDRVQGLGFSEENKKEIGNKAKSKKGKLAPKP